MKKLIVLFAIAFVVALGITASAATKKATLINGNGDKVVVAVGSSQAQYYFGLKYWLMGSQPKLGAVSGPDITSPYVSFNNTYKWFSSHIMTKATTTLCVISPSEHGSATSTLDNLLIGIPTATSTASTIIAATSTSAFASSTEFFMSAQSTAANAKNFIKWTPAAGTVRNNLIAPNEYILIQTEGAGLGGYTYTGGACKAELTQF